MIDVQNLLLYSRNGVKRLNIPALHINSPGITALVGHNGAGKSSLLKLIAGLDQPSAGSILYHGKNTFLNYETIKSEIHLLSWGIELFKSLTANDHFNLMKKISPVWDTEIETELLKDLIIPLDKKIERMSRGEQVRLRLLLSLPRAPKIILLDEVTNDLDNDSRRAIFKNLDKYTFATGAQVIVATNMIEDIERYATGIILLRMGEVILQDSLDTVKEKHKTSFEEIIRIYEKEGAKT
ncbi:ATP-binding cassette domain-containing protein [Pigmentibacter sp. JX0631]|uniref:ATP-binding cassette domain-containing protein n=1 Tax=Pigmentibacter sp. JX0631 TaxID=2976982 RepID=UPI002469132A|nr:ATP-binding cassette domain-containing protein [Pigmentibacter sp. JX0631]WGL58769.1 ATP-binding cassette domain-containing protein [Pigmentibacter sp. JX0631]